MQLQLPPYVGSVDRKEAARLRLKRIKARRWMRDHGFRDLGSLRYAVKRLENPL